MSKSSTISEARGATEKTKSRDVFDIHLDPSKTGTWSEHDFSSTLSSPHSTSVYVNNSETGGSVYYTSTLEEGYANIEEVHENDLQTNVSDENEEDEILIATPVDYDFFSDRFNTSSYDYDLVLPENLIYTRPESVATLTSPDHVYNSYQSDSDDSESDISLKLFSDASSDDDYTFEISPKYFGINVLEDRGNLPNFTKLDPVDKENDLFKVPITPLVSKRTPKTTSSYSSESRVGEPSHTSSSKSDSLVKDSDGSIKKKTLRKTDGRKTATFCSTNIQSALLSKITPDSKALQDPSFDHIVNTIKQRPVQTVSQTDKTSSKSIDDRNIEVDLENFETEVGKAFRESLNEGSFMPLLKKELQCKIQVRRLSKGESELVLEPEEPKVYKLTEEEVKKRSARLEQNRRSAKKSRHKAKTHELKLLKHIKTEMTKNASLAKEIEKLKLLRDEYKRLFDLHLTLCTVPKQDNR